MEGTLCIDVGGSKYLAGAISADGKLLYCQKYTWQKHDRGNRLRILQKLFDAMDELVSLFPQYAHSPMGMTVPGLADSVRGIWISCAFLGIGQLNIGQLFSRRYGVPLYLENDANACAVAEYHWGKGKDCQSFMYLTISNSIGSALFLGGDIYQGSSQTAGEIGMCLVEDLLSGDGLRRYPLEDLASGRGLAQNYQRISHCYSEQPIAADVLAALAEKGDSSARKAFELEGIYLGRAIARCAFLFNPEKVILGGGVTLAFSWFQNSLHNTLHSEMRHLLKAVPQVSVTSLGYENALLGAASLAIFPSRQCERRVVCTMEPTEQIVLGIDVGGTKIRYGLVNSAGQILAYEQYPARPMPVDEWYMQLIEELDAFLEFQLKGKRLWAIGIGVKGSVDHRHQTIRSSSVIQNAKEMDICTRLQSYYHVPVFIENDVKASALRELLFGIGQREKTFACINVGTGLAMGLVIDGELIHGIHNNAGEIGNLLYHRLDNGEIACLETVASGKGLEQEAIYLQSHYQDDPLFGSGIPNGRQLVNACAEGSPLACQVLKNMIHHLALTLINLDTALDIGTYVMAGGVMANNDMMRRLSEEIQQIASQVQYNIFGWHADLILSDAGADLAGLAGAASVAFYQSDQLIKTGCK